MFEIIAREVSSCDLKDVVGKLIPDSIGKEIEKSCSAIFPLQNVAIHKVKVLKMPKYDVQKLLELHTEGGIISEEAGKRIERSADATFVEPIPSDSV